MKTTCTPSDTYVIIEKIYSKSVLPGLKIGIGPELVQVARQVWRVCDIEERLLDKPNGWQIFQHWIGWKSLATRLTGESDFIHIYTGFKNVVTPLPKIGGLLPESWTSAHLTPTPTLFHYGRDPIPHIRLYGNPTVNFMMPGGKPPAAAIAIYHRATHRLEFPDPAQQERILRSLATQP